MSPLDPEVFSPVDAFVRHLLDRRADARLSPLEVADKLEGLAEGASRRIDWIGVNVPRPDAEVRRWLVDVRILAALGRFYAGKLRAAVWYELHVETGDLASLRRAIEHLSSARDAWADAAERGGAYVGDLTYGPEPRLRGHWRDRLPAIESDLQDMQDRLRVASPTPADGPDVAALVAAALDVPAVDVVHEPPYGFRPGRPLALRIGDCGEAARVVAAKVRYRPMNQALSFSVLDMRRTDEGFVAELPPRDLTGEYQLAYAFELRDEGGAAWRHPGLGATLTDQPYVVVRPQRHAPARDERSDDGT